MNDYLTQVSLLRLIGVMLLVLLPHFWRIPAWEILLILSTLGWRTLAILRQWSLPRPAARILLTLLTAAGVYASYDRLHGQAAGTALIAAMCALKLLEMRSRRDVMVTVFLMYFVLLTHFIISQEMWTVIYLMVCAIGITAFLIEVSHASVGTPEPLPLQQTLRLGSFMVACALPMMLALFVLFPRLPGPLWGLPADAGASRSGLPDSMSPGDISDLILSSDPVFRVEFFGEPPPMRNRYWRGPVFDTYDGRAWKPSAGLEFTWPQVEYLGRPLAYEITAEPVRTRWLMALDLPNPKAIPGDALITSDHQLVARKPVTDRMLYRAESYPDYRLQAQLSPERQQHYRQLPDFGNSSTRTLAREWRSQNLDDAQIVQRALQYFRAEPFYYTLQPPKLGANSVDEFLFTTRKGFCEHYSSAFTFLMRAAGVPARVVVGFQGGVKNDFGDFYTVRQSDAHAWSEVWLEGKGWVRVDPTAAVAPNRIELGVEEALLGSSGETLPEFMRYDGALWTALEARWEWLDSKWNYWVLAYGPELQQDFLRQFGITDWSGMMLALTIIGTLMMAVIGALLLRQYRSADTADAALRLWRRAQRVLEKHGIVQRPHEGPRDFSERVAQEEPELQQPMNQLLAAYLHARYLGDGGETEIGTLKAAVARLRG